MPTVLEIEGFRFFFYSGDRGEPRHIHVRKGDALAKFWLRPVSLASSEGFRTREITHIFRLVMANEELLKEKWDEFFA